MQIMHIQRSIVSVQKRAELELYINNETPDIIGITESWTKPEIADSELALDGYRLFRKDRENQKSEGCCCMSSAVLIQLKMSKMLVGACYRVPDATEKSDHGMYKLLEK